MMAGWGADFPTGYGFLSVLVTAGNPASGNNNYSGKTTRRSTR